MGMPILLRFMSLIGVRTAHHYDTLRTTNDLAGMPTLSAKQQSIPFVNKKFFRELFINSPLGITTQFINKAGIGKQRPEVGDELFSVFADQPVNIMNDR
jgi:hypothetical protein